MRRVGKEGRVDRAIVESRHRPGIEPQRARREEEIGALKAGVAKGRGLRERLVADEPAPRIGVREQVGQVVEELMVHRDDRRSEEHTSELQSLMRISYAVF